MRAIVVALLAAASPALAQPDEPPVQEITPEEPEPPPPPPPDPTPAPVPTPTPKPVKPAHVHTMDEVEIPQTYLRFGINFFGDVSYLAATPAEPNTAFTIGALGVRMLGTLSPSVDALGELAFETTDDGPLADVEQVVVRWRHGHGVLELGRSHTNLGYWNTAYHHGLWLQTPIERPRAVRFEDDGGLVPVHWVGATYTYTAGPIAIAGGIANGRGDIVDDILVGHDNNDAKAVLLKLRYKQEGFEIGAGGIYDRIAPVGVMLRPALANQRIDEVIANAYLVVRGEGPLAIAEGYAFHHRADGETWNTFAAYGLVGYQMKDWFTPYAAVDLMRGAGEDPYFTPDPMATSFVDLVEGIVGARFDTSTWSAIKLELRLLHPDDGGDDVYTAAANWSFGL